MTGLTSLLAMFFAMAARRSLHLTTSMTWDLLTHPGPLTYWCHRRDVDGLELFEPSSQHRRLRHLRVWAIASASKSPLSAVTLVTFPVLSIAVLHVPILVFHDRFHPIHFPLVHRVHRFHLPHVFHLVNLIYYYESSAVAC